VAPREEPNAKLRLRSLEDPSRLLAKARQDAAIRRLSRHQANATPTTPNQVSCNSTRLGAKPVADGGESSPRGGHWIASGSTAAPRQGSPPTRMPPTFSGGPTPPSRIIGTMSVPNGAEPVQLLNEAQRVLQVLTEHKERLSEAYDAVTSLQERAAGAGSDASTTASGCGSGSGVRTSSATPALESTSPGSPETPTALSSSQERTPGPKLMALKSRSSAAVNDLSSGCLGVVWSPPLPPCEKASASDSGIRATSPPSRIGNARSTASLMSPRCGMHSPRSRCTGPSVSLMGCAAAATSSSGQPPPAKAHSQDNPVMQCHAGGQWASSGSLAPANAVTPATALAPASALATPTAGAPVLAPGTHMSSTLGEASSIYGACTCAQPALHAHLGMVPGFSPPAWQRPVTMQPIGPPGASLHAPRMTFDNPRDRSTTGALVTPRRVAQYATRATSGSSPSCMVRPVALAASIGMSVGTRQNLLPSG